MRGRDDGWVDTVLGFWFDTLRPKEWWGGSAEVDAMVRTRFADLLDALTDAPPDAAALDGRGHLAAVIVLDQFPRNLHRGAPRAFATDALALALTIDAIERNMDASLTQPQRQFLYMPLMHGEDAATQRRSLVMFARLDDPRPLRSAQAHHDTFVRFGRFPYRNEALGRRSTAEELAWLAAHPGPD